MIYRRELAKLGALFRRRKPVDDLAEEIRAHLEMEEQENRESGMPPEEVAATRLILSACWTCSSKMPNFAVSPPPGNANASMAHLSRPIIARSIEKAYYNVLGWSPHNGIAKSADPDAHFRSPVAPLDQFVRLPPARPDSPDRSTRPSRARFRARLRFRLESERGCVARRALTWMEDLHPRHRWCWLHWLKLRSPMD